MVSGSGVVTVVDVVVAVVVVVIVVMTVVVVVDVVVADVLVVITVVEDVSDFRFEVSAVEVPEKIRSVPDSVCESAAVETAASLSVITAGSSVTAVSLETERLSFSDSVTAAPDCTEVVTVLLCTAVSFSRIAG